MKPKRTQTEYMWKFWSESDQRYYTPRGDPRLYEHPFDFVFDTPDKAREALELWDVIEEAVEDNWALVKVTYEPVEVNDDAVERWNNATYGNDKKGEV